MVSLGRYLRSVGEYLVFRLVDEVELDIGTCDMVRYFVWLDMVCGRS
jgi:hypothetical protein